VVLVDNRIMTYNSVALVLDSVVFIYVPHSSLLVLLSVPSPDVVIYLVNRNARNTRIQIV
jgi:hypothetical protein